MDMTHIATITHAPRGTSGLNFRKAVELFVGDVKEHSRQNVIGQMQDDGNVYVFCPAEQDVVRAQNSARMAEKNVRPHVVRFMDMYLKEVSMKDEGKGIRLTVPGAVNHLTCVYVTLENGKLVICGGASIVARIEGDGMREKIV
ncbi:MAG: hypothetical protein NUV60_03035 [Patescibacteria group bacterium]|nr:hypothetical protein [Patescibacteria group bacterium]